MEGLHFDQRVKLAERHGVISQRTGAARNTRDYYGILAVAALAKLYEQGGEISVFGSHAPGDLKFREDLMRSVVGEWEVEMTGYNSRFKVVMPILSMNRLAD